MSQIEESFQQAIDLVVARVHNDTAAMSAVLDGLDRDGAERLASTLAAAFAQFGVGASGGPEEFVGVLRGMRQRF